MPSRATPPAGSIHLAISGQAPGGSDWANVFWISSVTVTPSSAQMATLASDMYTLWSGLWLEYLPSNWTTSLCKVTYYGSDSLVMVGEATPSDSGSSDASQLPDQVTTVVSWKVDTTWRGGKPRTYFVGVSTHSDLADNAHIGSTRQGELTTLGGDWLEAVNAMSSGPFASMTLVCMRFFRAGAQLDPPQALPIVGATVPSRICTIRRRLGRELT